MSYNKLSGDIELQNISEDDYDNSTEIGTPSSSFSPSSPTRETGYYKFGILAKIEQVVLRFYHGPKHPIDLPPKFKYHYLNKFDELPKQFNKISDLYKKIIYSMYLIIILVIINGLLINNLFSLPSYNGKPIVSLSCGLAEEVWSGHNNKCGFNGSKCLEKFNKEESIIIKCPAFCDLSGIAYSAIPYGDKLVKYEPFVIESLVNETIFYRGDSFPCASALKQGLISKYSGGSLVLNFKNHYPFNNESDFNSFFPAAFTLSKLDTSSNERLINGYDYRILNLTTGILICLPVVFISPNFGFFVTVLIMYFFITLSIDTPIVVKPEENLTLSEYSAYSLFSVMSQRFLPLASLVVLIWLTVCKYTLMGSGIARVIWCISLWFTGANNLTFDRLPIDRLILSDIKSQKYGLTSLIFLILLTLGCITLQILKLWKSGSLFRVLSHYLLVLIVITVLVKIFSDKLYFRIHHWLIGLFFIFGTRTKWVGSYIFQGLLLGLIINGVGRWGFASVFEMKTLVLRNEPDANKCSPIGLQWNNTTNELLIQMPKCDNNNRTSNYTDEDTVTDPDPHTHTHTDTYSLLINDIEMYKGDNNLVSLNDLLDKEYFRSSENIYFRAGHYDHDNNNGEISGYTRAGILDMRRKSFIRPTTGLT